MNKSTDILFVYAFLPGSRRACSTIPAEAEELHSLVYLAPCLQLPSKNTLLWFIYVFIYSFIPPGLWTLEGLTVPKKLKCCRTLCAFSPVFTATQQTKNAQLRLPFETDVVLDLPHVWQTAKKKVGDQHVAGSVCD